MPKVYGMPYKGSKNKIATWIVDNLPAGDTLIDVFCGGCAVTHAALLSRKWKNIIINDIDGRMPQLFIDSIHGKYTVENHPEWVTRAEFKKKRFTDAQIGLCWSLGDNCLDYIYGKSKEDLKLALHVAVYKQDFKLLAMHGIHIERIDEPDLYKRYQNYRKQTRNYITRGIEHLESLHRLESLQELRGVPGVENLKVSAVDYSEIEIPPGAVLYCDPPYAGTRCGFYTNFDTKRFLQWARRQKNIYVSEYNMPADFVRLCERQKTVTSAANNNALKAVEALYTNQITAGDMM